MPSKIPIVAIVGRPNVGKSTLFNRYAGWRQALVENSPGVTRDRIFADIDVSGRPILLIDTAGLDREAERGLPRAVQAQAWIAVHDADAILFVVDGKSGLVPEDESLAKTLHRTSKPVSVVVNKIDVPNHEPRVAEFHSLGFARVEGVSAEHGRGAWDALEALVAELPHDEGQIADDGGAGVRVALVGRPNVGKSSLVNRLAGVERVVVSDVPGTTRDAIDTRIEREGEIFTLVDTAGLRRQGRRSETTEHVSALMSVRSLDRATVALVAIDASEGFTDQDARVAHMARERGCATAVVANKWDLVVAGEPGRAQEVRDQMAHGLRFMSDSPVLAVSALTGSGVDKILGQVKALSEVGQRRIATAELNRWLEETVTRHEPAMAQRGPRKHPLKLFYATQTSVTPPTFVIFCNQPDAVKVDYKRFLENQLRERFDLAGTPIRIRLRARQH